MESILSDTTKFKPLNDDPIKTTFKRESTAIRFLRKLNKCKVISNELFSKLAPTGSRPCQLFFNSNHFECFSRDEFVKLLNLDVKNCHSISNRKFSD